MEISAKNLRVMDQMPPCAPRYHWLLLFNFKNWKSLFLVGFRVEWNFYSNQTLFNPHHRLFRLCLPPSDGDLWMRWYRSLRPSKCWEISRLVYHFETMPQHISTPGQPHPERSGWGQHDEEWEPSDHLYLLLWQLRKSLMLTMLILTSSVCPHCYIVWSPNGSGLACDWLNLTVKGCIISSFRL